MPHIGPHVTLDEPAYIHDTALLYGKVIVGKDASIWPHVVTRAEVHEIEIGARTNIQDHVMIHVGFNTGTTIGEDCSIAHRAVLHGCSIGNRVLVGIGSIIMDGAEIGDNSIVAGNAIVTEGVEFPPNSIVGGSPARLIKSADNSVANLRNAQFYLMNARNYAEGLDRLLPEEMATLMSS
ncbi:MAG: gamma carbonic anhydrase family protein [Pseudomonadota bacterium]